MRKLKTEEVRLINIEIIENYRKSHNLNIADFCKLCGLHISTYYKLVNDDLDLYFSSMFKVAKVLDVEVSNLFNKISFEENLTIMKRQKSYIKRQLKRTTK